MGYFLSKASRLTLVDESEFMRELMVRGIKCEMPGCDKPAVGIIASAIAACLCVDHRNIWLTQPGHAKLVEGVIANFLKEHSVQAANAAYAASEGEVTFTVGATEGILNKARRLLDAEAINEATPVTLPKISLPDLEPAGIRPTLASLDVANSMPDLPDFFVV